MKEATIDFNLMMRGLLKPINNREELPIICSKIEPMYEISSLGFEGMQVKSFFKPTYRIRGKKKC